MATSDPVPGEPETITVEARRLRDMATEMRSQIARLHTIGRDDTLTGQYADNLRTAASDLAGKLEKTVGRYQRVSGELASWAPELTHAQTESVRALEKAKAAEAARAANTVIQAAPRPGDPPPTPAEQAQERRRQSALDDAATDLAAARRHLDDAIEHAQNKGRHYAGRIKDAIDDDVKDSWWDHVKGWVDRNAGWIKKVADVLSMVATALAVVALFIPGVNILMVIAAGLTVAALAGHTLLAASGDGSWADVGLDIFALATFGLGKAVTGALKGVQAATRVAGARAAGRAAEAAALRSSRAARTAAGRTLSRRGVSAAQRRGARRLIDTAKHDARQAGIRAAADVRDAPLAGATSRDALRAGNDVDVARYHNDISAIRSRFPGNADVTHASPHADLLRNTNTGAFTSGFGADATDKVGEYGRVKPYTNAKEHFTREVGSTW